MPKLSFEKLSTRTLERARAGLKAEGLIDWRRQVRPTGVGQGAVWWYRLDLPEPDWGEVWGES